MAMGLPNVGEAGMFSSTLTQTKLLSSLSLSRRHQNSLSLTFTRNIFSPLKKAFIHACLSKLCPGTFALQPCGQSLISGWMTDMALEKGEQTFSPHFSLSVSLLHVYVYSLLFPKADTMAA